MNTNNSQYIPKETQAIIDLTNQIREQFLERRNLQCYDFTSSSSVLMFRRRVESDIEKGTKWLRKHLKTEELLAPLERTGQHKKKRADSVMKYAPVAEGMFADQYPTLCISDELSKTNAMPVGIDFETCDKENYVQLAAALWILDELKLSGKLEDAYQFFSEEDVQVKNLEFPQLYDPCYSNEIICRMLMIVKERDKRKSNGQLSGRERFEKIIELLNPAKILFAKKNFEKKQWEYFCLVLDVMVYFREKELEEIEETIPEFELCDSCYDELLSLYNEISAQFDRVSLTMQDENSLCDLEIARAISINNRIDEAFKDAKLHAGMVQKRYDWMELLDKRRGITRAMGTSLSSIFESLPVSKCLKEMEKKICNMTVEDPFETCFVYLYMRFIEDDAVWLYNQAIAVLYAAVPLLPWYKARNYRRDWTITNVDAVDSLSVDDDLDLTEEGDETPIIYTPDPAVLYRKDYTDACLWADPEIVPKNELSKRNLSQLIYEMTGVLLPRKGGLGDDYSKLLHQSRMKKQQCAPYEMLIRYLTSQRERSLMPMEQKNVAATESPDIEQTKKYKEDIKRLNTQLRETHDKKNAERKRANQAECQNERYKAEIAELRSMLYDRTAFAREEKRVKVDYPYTVKRKITIFGGHEVWLNLIKPLLNGVRYVGPDEKPNMSVLMNTDVIWLQTNVMAHSFYNKVVEVARTHNIPVRYFSYSGAEKCAEQLALDDMKS